jgi:5-methylcytosine-specific restriction protein A
MTDTPTAPHPNRFVAFVASSKWGMSGVGLSVFEAGLLAGQCAWGHSRAVLEEMAAGDYLLLGYGELGNAPAELGAWRGKQLAVAVLCRLTSGLFEDTSVWPPSGSDFYDESHIFRINVEEMHRWELPNPKIINDSILEGFRESARRLGAPYQLEISPTGTAFDTKRIPMTAKPIMPIPLDRARSLKRDHSDATDALLDPTWTRDELILTLDLYLRNGQLDPSTAETLKLTGAINRLPVHPMPPGQNLFRNVKSVSAKLATFADIDPSRRASSKVASDDLDREVWDRFASDPAALATLAEKIEFLASARAPEIESPVDGEDDIAEGRIVLREHRLQEQNRKLIAQKMREVVDTKGRIRCEICRFDFKKTYGPRGAGFFEVHHLVPLASPAPRTDSTDDLLVVCANCHRVIHRSEPWLTPRELRSTLAASKK